MLRKLLPVAVFTALLIAGVAIASFDNRFALSFKHSASAILPLSGNIEAHESVLSFKTVQSRIVELPFDEGQWVHRGDVIARLDDADYQQNVNSAGASLEQAKQQVNVAIANVDAANKTVINAQADLRQRSVDYQRAEALWEGHAISAHDRDMAETAFEQSNAALMRDQAMLVAASKTVAAAQAGDANARESLKLAEIILSYTILRAPYNGVVLTRQAELGEVMLPGAPVVTIADLDHVWMRGYLNETDLGRVRLGEAAAISTDSYPNRKYEGHISSIASQAEFTPKSVETHSERVTLVYRIKIDVYNPTHELVPGMPADANIELNPSVAGGKDPRHG